MLTYICSYISWDASSLVLFCSLSTFYRLIRYSKECDNYERHTISLLSTWRSVRNSTDTRGTWKSSKIIPCRDSSADTDPWAKAIKDADSVSLESTKKWRNECTDWKILKTSNHLKVKILRPLQLDVCKHYPRYICRSVCLYLYGVNLVLWLSNRNNVGAGCTWRRRRWWEEDNYSKLGRRLTTMSSHVVLRELHVVMLFTAMWVEAHIWDDDDEDNSGCRDDEDDYDDLN